MAVEEEMQSCSCDGGGEEKRRCSGKQGTHEERHTGLQFEMLDLVGGGAGVESLDVKRVRQMKDVPMLSLPGFFGCKAS